MECWFSRAWLKEKFMNGKKDLKWEEQMKAKKWHNDSAHPHAAIGTVEAMHQPQLKCLPHAPYSPDLVPFDYHVPSPHKEALCGHRFTSDDDVQI